jgi:hypothetical protein
VSSPRRTALALLAIGIIVLQYAGTVFSAINSGWVLGARATKSLFAALDTLSLPDGQRYLFVSIATVGCLVVWRMLSGGGNSDQTARAHGQLLRLWRRPRESRQTLTSAEASWSRWAKEIRRRRWCGPAQTRITPGLSPSELGITVELRPGADVERAERLALNALHTLDCGRAIVHVRCARQGLPDGGTRLQIGFCVTDVTKGKLHVLSDARASLWDCLHKEGVPFALRTSS